MTVNVTVVVVVAVSVGRGVAVAVAVAVDERGVEWSGGMYRTVRSTGLGGVRQLGNPLSHNTIAQPVMQTQPHSLLRAFPTCFVLEDVNVDVDVAVDIRTVRCN